MPTLTMSELYDKAFLELIAENPDTDTEDTYQNSQVFQRVKNTQPDFRSIYRLEYLENLEQMKILVSLKGLLNDPVIREVIARHIWSYILFLRTVDADEGLINAVKSFHDTISIDTLQSIMDTALRYRNHVDPDLFAVLKDLSDLAH